MFFLWNQRINIVYPNEENVFFQIDRQALILKMVDSEVFLMNPRHQYHLSQWGECVYGAHSWNEKRLLFECIYPNRQTNIISKNGSKRSFSCEIRASISFIPIRRMCLWCPIKKWKEIIVWILVYPNWKMNLNTKNGRKRSFPMKPKHQYHSS